MFDLQKIIRKNIWDMEAYSAARDLVKKGNYIFLDANENPYGVWNRYPDPLQSDAKSVLAKIKGVVPENMVMGNGSDEILDLIYRISCTPGKDNAVSLAPSYGMYYTLACLNNIEFREVMLNAETFDFDPNEVLAKTDEHTKLIIICNPNNPTGNSFDNKKITYIAENFNGIVVIDEAYNDFSQQESCIEQLKNHSNIIVVQTFSKAWGLASLRAGVGYMRTQIAAIINKVKMPYNMDGFTQKSILEKLSDIEQFKNTVKLLGDERKRLMEQLQDVVFIEKIYPSQANFFMIRTSKHKELQKYLLDNGIIVRSRHTMPLCQNCIRITVGTPEQNNMLVELIKKFA